MESPFFKSFVGTIEDFIQGVLKLVKAFFALLGIDFSQGGDDPAEEEVTE